MYTANTPDNAGSGISLLTSMMLFDKAFLLCEMSHLSQAMSWRCKGKWANVKRLYDLTVDSCLRHQKQIVPGLEISACGDREDLRLHLVCLSTRGPLGTAVLDTCKESAVVSICCLVSFTISRIRAWVMITRHKTSNCQTKIFQYERVCFNLPRKVNFLAHPSALKSTSTSERIPKEQRHRRVLCLSFDVKCEVRKFKSFYFTTTVKKSEVLLSYLFSLSKGSVYQLSVYLSFDMSTNWRRWKIHLLTKDL